MMMEISTLEFKTQNELDSFKEKLKEKLKEDSGSNRELNKKKLYLFFSYLDDAFKRTCLLQVAVENNIAKDLIATVVLPYDPYDEDSTIIQFYIDSNDGREVRKREQLLFEGYCDKYFKGIVSLKDLFQNAFA